MNLPRQLLLVSILALVVPAAALTWADADRRAAGLVGSPFGWGRILAAHLLAGLPLAVLLARQPARLGSGVRLVGLGAALLVTAWTVLVGETAAPFLDAAGTGFWGRLMVRSCWCLALQVPWFLAAAPTALSAIPVGWLSWLTAALAAFILPGTLAAAFITEQAGKAAELLGSGRLVQARNVVWGISDLSGPESLKELKDTSPVQLIRELGFQIAALQRACARPLSAAAGPEAAYERAFMLAQLDRLDEAVAVLGRPETPHALLLLAAVRQAQERFDASNAAYEQVLQTQRPMLGYDPAARALYRRACDGLAFNARACGTPAAAELVYRTALQEQADLAERAYFHFQLAGHYQRGGRPLAALEHLDQAVQLDPATFSRPAESMRRELRQFTPSCLARLPGR